MEEKKEKWLNYLAIATVLLAVSATLSTFYGQRYATRAVLNEIKSSNQWNYYQAKKIRGYLYEVQKETMETDLKLRENSATPEMVGEIEKRIAGFESKIKKWNADQDRIEKDARHYEQTRDGALVHGQAFGIAVVFLQMAILLSSIAALMKKKYVWYVGLIVGAVGLVYFVDGFFVFM